MSDATPEPAEPAESAERAKRARFRFRLLAADPAVARIVFGYVIGAALWILLSDRLVTSTFTDPAHIAAVSVAKGWLFVIVTGVLLYIALARARATGGGGAAGGIPAGDVRLRDRIGLYALLVGVLVVVGAGAGGIVYTTSRVRTKELVALTTIANLRADQLAAWISERRHDARAIADDERFADALAAWLRGRRTTPRNELAEHLQSYVRSGTYATVALVDDAGHLLLEAGEHSADFAPPLREALRTALATGRPTDTDLYRDASGRPWLDFVVPVHGEPGAVANAVVLRIDPDDRLYPMLRAWPLASASAETELLRREGDAALFVSPLRFRAGAELRVREPLADARHVGARVVASDPLPQAAFEGIDYRGTPVIAWAQAVPDTRWLVVTKVDRSEMTAAALREAIWIGLAGTFAIVAIGFAVLLANEHRGLLLLRELRVEQDEKLRAGALLASIAASSTDTIYAKDREGRYLLFNGGAERVTGRAAADVLGRGDDAVFPPDIAERMRESDRNIMTRRAVCTHDEQLVLPTGTTYVLTTKGPLYGPGGEVAGVFGISRDVTERVRAEQELELHRHHLANLVQQRTTELEAANRDLARQAAETTDLYDRAPCGYHSVDRHGVLIRMNATELGWLGYTREEIVGRRRVPELLTPASAALFNESFPTVVAGGEVRNLAIEFVRRDGSVLPVLVNSISVRDAQGEFVESRATLVDVTELRVREREVARLNAELARRADDAEAATRAKSTFLANMSHEIRTPMNAILGLTHLMRRASTNAAQSERLDKVADAATHLLAVVDDVLDLSKIEAGKLGLEAQPVDLRSLLGQVRDWSAERAREKGLVVELDVHADVPAVLVGDPTRLRQALLNYAGNAVKFTERGHVVLRARPETDGDAGADAAQVRIRFEVEDTGIGVPEDAQGRLFAAFEQADGSTTRRFGGTGLGLAITRLLAQRMGGEAGCTSAVGRGSTFWFTALLARAGGAQEAAPAGRESQAVVPDESVLRGWWRGLPVLLAEDNPINREVAEELLTAVGLSVDVADDGASALARVQRRRYAAVLMDVQMPVMDGLAAARAIRALPDQSRLPIIAMTASATSGDRAATRDAGMSDFIAKPFTPRTLYATLMNWLPHGMRLAEPPREDPYSRIAGLDAARGLPFAGNDPARYGALLRRFVARAAIDLAECRRHIAHGDAVAARRAAHGLRGAASLVGASALHTLATELEGELADGAIGADADALARRVELAIAELDGALAGLPCDEAAPAAGGATARAG